MTSIAIYLYILMQIWKYINIDMHVRFDVNFYPTIGPLKSSAHGTQPLISHHTN